MIGTGAGGFWALIGGTALPRSWTLWADGVAVILTVILMRRLWSSATPNRRDLFRRHAYRVAVALEVVALAAVGVLLVRYRLEAYLVPAIGIVVGLHFIGLWRASAQSKYLWIAGAMCAISAVSIALPTAPIGLLNERMLFAGYGNAVILWIGATRGQRIG